ncbi:MAG TPA: SDR family NAD(P)-dependent oxidoreductase [Bryobacteraceae bacterium]|nr:SDR family NAD(P)-dependent oxidoreductase [Bryobacteraceae bacterium]
MIENHAQETENQTAPLRNKVAVVTGASRGAGRGIAVTLGAAGATVYVTGRSVRGQATTENLPGTVEETAELVSARGGTGIAVRCDHTVDSDVEELFGRVQREEGRIDLLVNNAWGGYEHHNPRHFVAPFYEQPLRHWEGMFTAGVRATLMASRFAATLMLPRREGLIINITAWDRDKFLGNVFYDVAKAAINRMSYGMARELRPHNIGAIALAPGFMRTERVAAAFEGAGNKDYLNFTESPEYVGRAVVALATDKNVLEKSGRVLAVGDLAEEYGFSDIDGRRIPAFKIPDEV